MKSANRNIELGSAIITVGEENILYVTLPYKGCTVVPRCLFCGVREQANRTLSIDEEFGRGVRDGVSKLLTQHSPDALVLYNGGNIIRPDEMHQPTIVSDIPNDISEDSICNAYEIEIRADDVLSFKDKLREIKTNLKGKKLRVRLGLEYYNNDLLNRHRKGMNTGQIEEAVRLLNELGIEWNGYAMFGGLDMTKKEAIEAVTKAGRFMLNNNAYKISINGMFVTPRLSRGFGRRIYIPSYDDLLVVLASLCGYKDEIASSALLKVGFEEEATTNVVNFPYTSESFDLPEVTEKLREFNRTQDIKSLMS